MTTKAKNAEKARRWRAANPESSRASVRRWIRKNRAYVTRKAKERYHALSPAERARRRRNYRGLPKPTRRQPKRCECCKGSPGRKPLGLDHDHATGKFRGWLCVKCNSGIGKLGDTVAGLRRAIRYLRRAK